VGILAWQSYGWCSNKKFVSRTTAYETITVDENSSTKRKLKGIA
jgi:hypothetical protein